MPILKAISGRSRSRDAVLYIFRRKPEELRGRPDIYGADNRTGFNASSNHLNVQESMREIRRHENGRGQIYRFVLNPKIGHGLLNWQQWTRNVMQEMQNYLQRPLPYIAVIHDDEKEHTHVHVVAYFERFLSKQEIYYMEDLATKFFEYEQGLAEGGKTANFIPVIEDNLVYYV